MLGLLRETRFPLQFFVLTYDLAFPSFTRNDSILCSDIHRLRVSHKQNDYFLSHFALQIGKVTVKLPWPLCENTKGGVDV
jgi:hypothetical protein